MVDCIAAVNDLLMQLYNRHSGTGRSTTRVYICTISYCTVIYSSIARWRDQCDIQTNNTRWSTAAARQQHTLVHGSSVCNKHVFKVHIVCISPQSMLCRQALHQSMLCVLAIKYIHLTSSIAAAAAAAAVRKKRWC
eukprot:18935-Heterococcus_DN1.PRE.1